MNPSNYQTLKSRSTSPSRRRAHSQGRGAAETARVDESDSTAPDGRGRNLSDSHAVRNHHHDHDDRARPRFKSVNLHQRNELESMANIETASMAGVRGSINHTDDGSTHHHHHNHHHDHNTSNSEHHPEHQPPRLNRIPSLYTPGMEDRLRRRLKVFFMDPCSKFRAKRQWPWKLSLQILKIVLVTVQLVIFGQQRSAIVHYFEQNRISLKHILLQGWDSSHETMPYPPATGQYALYTRKTFIDHINYAMDQYYTIPDTALGSFHLKRDKNETIEPINFCRKTYVEGKIFKNGSFVIDPNTMISCLPLVCPSNEVNITTDTGQTEIGRTYTCDIESMLLQQNASIEYDMLLELRIHMTVRSYHLDLFTSHAGPACFSSDVQVVYDNSQRDGQILVDLETMVTEIPCHGEVLSQELSYHRGLIIYDAFVILLCIMSLFLCLRSIYRAQKLKRETAKFFMNRFGKKLSFSDRTEFVNLWYILIVLNDILTVIGSAFKIQLEDQMSRLYDDVDDYVMTSPDGKFSSSSENYDIGSVALGVGCLFAWLGVLRYLGFFEKYNVLIITLKKAFPNVMRFLVCALALYFGFTFCGWLVLGPYHIKFQHLSTASECLFSLVNGDDMFVTFSATMSNSNLIWYFSRCYLYVFISLFIYVVLSLFIAVIMDTYETIKHYYENGFPKSDLWEFMEQCTEPPTSSIYHQDRQPCCCFGCLPFCNHEDPDAISERTHLLAQSI